MKADKEKIIEWAAFIVALPVIVCCRAGMLALGALADLFGVDC